MMGGLTGVLVRRSRDPQSHQLRPLRVGIRRREVAVDRYVTEVVMGDGDVVARGGRTWRSPGEPAPAVELAQAA